MSRPKKTTKLDHNSTIAEILGNAPKSPYSTKGLQEYSGQLQKMNLLDMQTHAVTLGLRPSGDRELLQKTLLNMFKTTNRTLVGLVQSKDVKISKTLTLLDIIKQGGKKA